MRPVVPASALDAFDEAADAAMRRRAGVPEACSCEEALRLRERLVAAARGTIAIHVVKEAGYWTIERWRDGALVESYVGVPTIAYALDRIGEWMRE
jgi:hypothetical protein